MVKLFRFTIVGEAPTDPVFVLIGAPHTSNWDFPITMAIVWATGLDAVWLAKKEMFKGPTGALFRWMGGVPVDRENPLGLVEAMIDLAQSGKHKAVLIAPEGGRNKGDYWKSGFRRIALGAHLNVGLCFVDRPTRQGGYGPVLTMTADIRADMDMIRAFYSDKQGMRPGRFTPPLLREEVETSGGTSRVTEGE